MEETKMQELAGKLEQAANAEEAVEIAKGYGVELSAEKAQELLDAKAEAADGAELTDAELDGAAGGFAWGQFVKDFIDKIL